MRSEARRGRAGKAGRPARRRRRKELLGSLPTPRLRAGFAATRCARHCRLPEGPPFEKAPPVTAASLSSTSDPVKEGTLRNSRTYSHNLGHLQHRLLACRRRVNPLRNRGMNFPLVLASGAAASSEVEPYSGWENLGLILSKPDNVPILIMIVLVSFFTYMALRDGFKNDRLTKQGRKQDILKSMQE